MAYKDKEQQRLYMLAWKKRKYEANAEYREKAKTAAAQRRLEKAEQVKAEKHQWYLRNAAKIREERKANRAEGYLKELKNKYGLDKEGYEKLLERSGRKCEVCGAEGPLAVDHCHDSLVVRGILCKWCNTGIGYFKDEPQRLRAAALYLERQVNALS